MKEVTLGMTGVDVSALCLGTMDLGTSVDIPMSMKIMDAYVESGGSFIDTANIYAYWVPGAEGGESEKLIGMWMKERRLRPKLFLASKVGCPYSDIPRSTKAEIIIQECEKTLNRLGVETIDLYYAHCDDRNTPMEETLAAFDKLIKQGKVRYIGASNFQAWRLNEALLTSDAKGLPSYCCIQQRYSYLRPKPGASTHPQVVANDELFDLAAEKKLRVLAFSTLLHGVYSRKDRPIPEVYEGPDSVKRLNVVREIAQKNSISPNQVVLAWLIGKGIIPISAASTYSQITENIETLDVSLYPDDTELLDTTLG